MLIWPSFLFIRPSDPTKRVDLRWIRGLGVMYLFFGLIGLWKDW